MGVCLLWVLCVCQVEVSATGWSLVQRSPTDCVVSCVWSRNLKNEEAKTRKWVVKASRGRRRRRLAMHVLLQLNAGKLDKCSVYIHVLTGPFCKNLTVHNIYASGRDNLRSCKAGGFTWSCFVFKIDRTLVIVPKLKENCWKGLLDAEEYEISLIKLRQMKYISENPLNLLTCQEVDFRRGWKEWKRELVVTAHL
jgi:hypothetical protein